MSVMSFSCPVRPKLVGLQQGLTLNCPCFIDTYLIHVHKIMIYYVMCKTQSSFPNLHIVPLYTPTVLDPFLHLGPRLVTPHCDQHGHRATYQFQRVASFCNPLGLKHHLLEGVDRIIGSVIL